MFKKLTMAGAAIAMSAAALVPTTPAMAQRYDGYSQRDGYRDNYRGNGYRNRNYYNNRTYRGSRAAQRCQDGDGGTIVGALAGGLAGNQIAGRGDRTLGTILGGVVGAVAGRAVDRSDRPGYCR
jgi:uncharacterized protein YcfJ